MLYVWGSSTGPKFLSYDPALPRQPGIPFSTVLRDMAPVRQALSFVLAQLAMGCTNPLLRLLYRLGLVWIGFRESQGKRGIRNWMGQMISMLVLALSRLPQFDALFPSCLFLHPNTCFSFMFTFGHVSISNPRNILTILRSTIRPAATNLTQISYH